MILICKLGSLSSSIEMKWKWVDVFMKGKRKKNGHKINCLIKVKWEFNNKIEVKASGIKWNLFFIL